MAQLIMSPVISRLDYCNSMFSDLPASSLALLQRVQNVATRLVLNLDWQSHIPVTSALQQLPWLPTKFHIIFKTAMLTHQSLHNCCLSYLTDLVDRDVVVGEGERGGAMLR